MIDFLLAIILLALPPSVYFPTLGVKRDQQREAESRAIQDLDIRIESARAAERKLLDFREEVRRLDEEHEKLKRILPPVFAIDEVRALIDSQASDHALRLTRFEARKPVKGAPAYDETEIEVEVIGSAGGTSEFLRRVQNAERIFYVSALTMQKDPGGWRTGFILTAYALPD